MSQPATGKVVIDIKGGGKKKASKCWLEKQQDWNVGKR